ELLELSRKAAGRLFPRSDGGVGRLVRRLLALAALSLYLRVHAREVAAVVLENSKVALAPGEGPVVHLPRHELAVDPVHDTLGSHTVHLARARPVRQSVQRMYGGIAGRERHRDDV